MDDAQFQNLLNSIGNKPSTGDQSLFNHVQTVLPDPVHHGIVDYLKNTPAPKQGILANVPGAIKEGAVSYAKNVGSQYMGSAKTIVANTAGVFKGTKKPKDALLQNAGEVAKSTFAPITEAIKPVVSGAAETLANNKTFQQVADTKVAGAVDKANTGASSFYQNWATKHPEAAKNLEAGVNIGALLLGNDPVNAVADTTGGFAKSGLNIAKKGLQTTSNAVESSLPKVSAGSADKAFQSTWDMIKPELTKLDQAKAVQEGKIVTKGKLGTITQVPIGRDLEMINAAHPYVSVAKNEIEAVAKMQQGIAEESAKLQQGLNDTGASYTRSQVKGALSKVEPPTMIAADSTLSKAYGLVKNKMISLVGEGGKLGDLLQARKNFDAFISKQFPNLYNSDTLTPMRVAIRDIRSALNDMIDSRLPDGSLADGTAFRDSLKKQSLLYDAIENTASKTPKVGSNAIQRFTKQHPNITKALKYGAGAVIGGEAIKHAIP